MHDTALILGKKFFDAYATNSNDITVAEIGSQDVCGSLKPLCPPKCNYIGVDFVEGKGVDIILEDPYKLPFEDESIDICVSSSCFEHSEFFWLLFNEILRVMKPHGVFYLNVPSNGIFHRYPVDCWRFYPDAGTALQNWGRKCGYNVTLIESFTGTQLGDRWNDFIAVFIKDEKYINNYTKRIRDAHYDHLNGKVYGENEFSHKVISPQDQIAHMNLNNILSFIQDEITQKPEDGAHKKLINIIEHIQKLVQPQASPSSAED